MALLQNPDQIEILRKDPGLWSAAIQELLRYASPLHGVLRTATDDLIFAGKVIRKGDRVSICLAAGNRDPAMFRKPEQLDIGRRPNHHLAFGLGIHRCLGSRLAETVSLIAIREILRQIPTLQIVDPNIRFQGNYLFQGQQALHVYGFE